MKPAGLPMPGIGEAGERGQQREAEATPGEEAGTAATPEVALPRAEAQDLATADSAYKRGDYATVLQLMRPMADAGNTRAQNKLGLMYENGRGVAKDDAQAVYWYRKAADQGEAYAQKNLGVMYANGRGVAKDEAQAVAWYRKAADQGLAADQPRLDVREWPRRGQGRHPGISAGIARPPTRASPRADELGLMYANGRGVAKDDAQAVAWYRKAADQGLPSRSSTWAYVYATAAAWPRTTRRPSPGIARPPSRDSPSRRSISA